MKFEDSWDNNTHQDVEDAIKDKVEEIEGRIDDVEDSVPDAGTIEAIRQAAQDAQDAAAAVGDIINENSGRVSHAKAPAVVLRYIHQNGTDDMSIDDLNAGDVYADAGGSLELIVIEDGSKTVKNIGAIDKGLIFYSIREEGFFRYLGSAAWELLSQGGGEEQEGTFAELDVDNRLKHIQSPVMVLDCISQSEGTSIADCPIGGYYCYMGNQASACRIRYRKALETAGSYRDIDLSSPQGHVLYYNKPEDKTYRWDGQKLVAVLWHAGLAIDNRLMSSRATAVVLWYISANLNDGETPMGANSGDVYCDSNNHIIVRGGTINPNKEYATAANLPTTPDADLGLPDQKLVYYDVNKKGFYRWNGVEWKKALDIDIDTTNLVTITRLNNTLSSYATKNYVDQAVQQAEQPKTVVINSDGANIVDEHNNNSVLLAPSARQMKLMYDNFMALYNSLANIAFTDGKPTLDWVGTKTKYTLSYGTLTGCTADVAAGQVNEGALRIKLTPTQASYAFTSVTVNGNSVTPVSTGGADGSVYIDIIVNQNVTVSATAVSGYNVNLTNNNGHCILSPTSVVAGATYNGTLDVEQHYQRPDTLTATMNGSPITFDGVTNSYDKNTGSLKISNVTGNIAITATATILPHITVTFPADHANMVIKHGNDELTGNSVNVYSDDKPYSLTVQPAEGYKFTTAPSATGGTITHVGNVYTLTIGQNDVTNIVISAEVGLIQRYSVTLPDVTGITAALQDASGNSLTSPVDEDTAIRIVLTPDAGYKITIGTITMGSDTLTEGTDYTLTDNNGVKTIAIAQVRGDVVVSASATNVNTAFKNVVCWKQSFAPARSMRYGNYDYITSPLVDISGCSRVTFDNGSTDNMAIFLYDSDMEYKTWFQAQSGGRTVDVTNYSYARISCKTTNKDSAYIKDADSNDVLWSGSEIADASLLPGAKDWEDSPFSIQPNENGDYIGRAFANDVSGTNVVDSIDGTSPNPFSLGKKIRLPKDGTEGKSNITFGTGGTKNNSGGLAFYDENGNRINSGYYTFNENPRTVEIGAQSFECVFMFPTGDYETAYIINANTGELLWGTAPTETNE